MTRDTLAPGVAALARALHECPNALDDWQEHFPDSTWCAEAEQWWAADVLRALSSADRLAIAGITEERLTTALHVAEIDCNPIMPVGGFYETPLAKHVAASNHDGSAERLLAALAATPVTPEGGEL